MFESFENLLHEAQKVKLVQSKEFQDAMETVNSNMVDPEIAELIRFVSNNGTNYSTYSHV